MDNPAYMFGYMMKMAASMQYPTMVVALSIM